MIMKNARLQRVFLIIASYAISLMLMGFIFNALLVPYDGTGIDMRPTEGWGVAVNNFFENQSQPLIQILAVLIAFSISYLLDKKLYSQSH